MNFRLFEYIMKTPFRMSFCDVEHDQSLENGFTSINSGKAFLIPFRPAALQFSIFR